MYMAPDGITGFRPGTVDNSEKHISEFDFIKQHKKMCYFQCVKVSLMYI